jgi:group I intron endonuclease
VVTTMMVIYKITNTINNKSYIGQTNNITRRLRRHRNDSRTLDSYLYRSVRKYGWEVFDVEIIEECNSKKELNERESYYIRKLNTYNDGYNMTLGGDGTVGFILSEESRSKIGKSNSKNYKI